MLDLIGIQVSKMIQKVENLENIRPITVERTQAHLNGLKVFLGPDGTYIRGSLPKYLNGQNALTLTRQGVCEAFEKLEKDTGLDLKSGIVYQAEIAATIPVKNPVPLYLMHWGTLPRFKKSIIADGETVTYLQKGRSFSGYDKAAEMLPCSLPEPLTESFALRLEYRIKKGIKRFVGRFFSPWEMIEPDNYRLMVHLWRDFYFSIPKQREVILNMKGMKPKELEKVLAAVGTHVIGQSRLNQFIDSGRKSGDLDKVTASRMRARVRDLCQDERITTREELTIELDEKVRQLSFYQAGISA